MNDQSKTNLPLEIGTVPWTDQDMVSAIPEFKSIYSRRPVADNTGGMKAPHAFLAWFFLSRLKPDLIVESGVFKGLGTWLLEQASPDAQLICLDVNFGNLMYRSAKAEYCEMDLSLMDFSERDLSNAIAFIDDHQNALMRMQQLRWKGFKRAIFEDNYPAGRGDCYSIKHMTQGVGFTAPEGETKPLGKRLKAAVRNDHPEHLVPSVPANFTHRNELFSNLKTLYEGPPLFRSTNTRWGDLWTDENYPTKPALLQEDDLMTEAQDYTWMTYIEFK